MYGFCIISGRLDLPIVSGKYLRKISDRTALQSGDNAEKVNGSSEDMGDVINAEQEKYAREAESFIKEWISSR